MATGTLEDRIVALERKQYSCPAEIQEVDESMRRCRQEVERLGLYSVNWKWVPESYYDCPLTQRAKILQAPSTEFLCKSLLLENKKATNNTVDFIYNPQFVLVVLQYDAELDTDLLTKSVRRLTQSVEDRLDASHFDWRVADASDNDRITGYQFNSVTPFGLLQEVPIYLSSTVAKLGYFWMGGGHVHLKLGIAVSDFLKVKNVKVMDVSVERTSVSPSENVGGAA
ncbi:aminoacyl-tRNA editing domain containing protein [Nitzschia inconspicua]|uniref:Aminoacyl-tRNA editing domain containing protein n=1 Tax=Nitzschia inconspicua TaxID=303405 RepID=A0A9K3KHY0_9STRA|nr:aminoacyl-tRNA editing domain containing protein [Nitzschia inconspicua]